MALSGTFVEPDALSRPRRENKLRHAPEPEPHPIRLRSSGTTAGERTRGVCAHLAGAIRPKRIRDQRGVRIDNKSVGGVRPLLFGQNDVFNTRRVAARERFIRTGEAASRPRSDLSRLAFRQSGAQRPRTLIKARILAPFITMRTHVSHRGKTYADWKA